MGPVCAIILNFNGRGKLDIFLRSFRKTRYQDYKVVVVDNGSTDSSMDDFRESYPWVDLLALKENQGFSGGNNAGIRYAVRKYDPGCVILLNNDMEVTDPGWMGELVRAATEEPRAGVVGCKLLSEGNIIQHAGGRFGPFIESSHPHSGETDDHSLDVVRDVDYVTGACFLMSRQALERAGVLDERYNPIYYEDSEYCCRVRRLGMRVIFDGKASLMHYHDRGRPPPRQQWLDLGFYRLSVRNKVRFILFNLPFWWWPTLFSRIIATSVIGRDMSGRLGLLPHAGSRLAAVFSAFAAALGSPSPLNTALRAGPAKA